MARLYYAEVAWSHHDILEQCPAWTKEQANDWLEDNEDSIQQTMIEAGWAAIREILPDTAKEYE